MLIRHLILSALMLMASTVGVAADTSLLMVEEPGCVWCARWNDEISHIYPKTDEGRAAPLQRIDIREARNADVTFVRPLTFTPTFVLVIDGHEVSRIEGYPGEDFFWGFLAQMLSKANIDVTG